MLIAQPCQVGIRELTGGQRSRLFSVLTRLVAQGEEANHQRSLCRILAAASNDPRLVEAFRDFDEIKVDASAVGKFSQQRFARLNSNVVERFLGEYASVVMNEAIEGLFRATGQDSAIVE